MKKVFFLPALFLIWGSFNHLAAQSCNPSPACKAICNSAKADAGSVKAAAVSQETPAPKTKASCAGTATASSQEFFVLPASLTDPGTAPGASPAKMNCNPKNCDPKNCDPSKCDMSKCVPANCVPAKCTGKADKSIRI
ncbi:MAG: hypothetical protein EP344_15260 [Bacteroidetes bacterium]|nr:MAG: hypothetical protein EP344_15260 [Bacteroidota bacterium]